MAIIGRMTNEPIKPTELYDALSKGFITSTADSEPPSVFEVNIRFRTLVDMQAAYRLLIQSCKAETDRRTATPADDGTKDEPTREEML